MESKHALRLPDDPTGIEEPHDVLAAEDFAMPSGPDRLVQKLRHGDNRGRVVAFLAAALAGLLIAARRRR